MKKKTTAEKHFAFRQLFNGDFVIGSNFPVGCVHSHPCRMLLVLEILRRHRCELVKNIPAALIFQITQSNGSLALRLGRRNIIFPEHRIVDHGSKARERQAAAGFHQLPYHTRIRSFNGIIRRRHAGVNKELV